jgi:hypothetical protein
VQIEKFSQGLNFLVTFTETVESLSPLGSRFFSDPVTFHHHEGLTEGVKGKVHPRTGHEDKEGSRSVVLLFL